MQAQPFLLGCKRKQRFGLKMNLEGILQGTCTIDDWTLQTPGAFIARVSKAKNNNRPCSQKLGRDRLGGQQSRTFNWNGMYFTT